MKAFLNGLGKFFGVFLRGQTYLNALYLFLAFPLGLFYFIFLVTGIAVGIPLIIVWVGLLFLLAVFAVWYGLIVFERQMAIWMLRVNIPPIERPGSAAPENQSLWKRFTGALSNPVTWKGLVYLFAKFPLGIVSFVLVVTFLSVSAALITVPFYYNQISYWDVQVAWYIVDTLPEALLTSLFGILFALVSMHVLNGLAWVSGQFARVMLGNFPSASAVAAAPAAAVPAAVTTTAVVEPEFAGPPEALPVAEEPAAPEPQEETNSASESPAAV